MKRKVPGCKADFPILEIVEDFAGKQRKFIINCHEGGLGYTVRASEEGKDGLGYQFAAYSETSPYSALGRATRHITTSQSDVRMLHDRLKGRITSAGEGRVAVVVDGIPLGIEEIE